MMREWDGMEAILRVSSLSEVARAAARHAREWGLDYYAYAARVGLPGSGQPTHFREFGNFPGEWADRYSASRYRHASQSNLEGDDPRLQHVRAGLPITPWTVAGRVGYTRADIGQRARSILRLAGEHGLTGGITVPLHSPGANWVLMTFATSSHVGIRDLAPGLAPTLHFASCLQVSMNRLAGESASDATLSPREREVLQWAAIGKTSWDISRILCISERTVNFHLSGAARRLQVNGRAAACARALALGQITI